jgi:hypothetical protein
MKKNLLTLTIAIVTLAFGACASKPAPMHDGKSCTTGGSCCKKK